MSTPALKLSNLTKTYRNGFTALKGIDLTVEKGDFFALLGPNGAGKSTTISIVTSLVTKSEGLVEINGINLEKTPVLAKMNVGVVPQEFNFNPFEKVKNILTNQAMFYGIPLKQAKSRAVELLKQMDLYDKRNARARFLSGGMKRRLMIARALMHAPTILILDEPTAGVDIEIRQSMWAYLQKINKAGVTIILTTHYLEEAETLCNKIAIIDHGQIVINTSMQALLSELDSETIIIETSNEIDEDLLDPDNATVTGPRSFELTILKSNSLTDVVHQLAEANIHVHRIRPKANRLEQLFVGLIDERKKKEASA